jgi:S-DNA-T family DNA segregation ATPase FtsK/SpoIIIE
LPLAAKYKNKKPVQEKITWPKQSVKIDLPIEILNNKFSKAVGGDIEFNAQKIKNTLEKFGIEVEMGETKVGPTVTQYAFRPAEGVKLSRITTLSNDLSLALAAHPIRIEAPIPGKSLVGVEVPNRAKAIVGLREVLEDEAFKTRKNNMFIALGKDVAGQAWLYDLTKMPHLLVAGATNSGKSVCLNAIIVSLLYQNNPDALRFIMVDPKRVELPTYNGIPHLLTPVITEVSKTINSLKWCLNEMDRRYDLLNKSGKKNIQAYNQTATEKLPFIVYIIDELADFMMTAGKEMEAAIIRLAQMSRAIGIHLILATQRPSVDVITGLIKANIPTRIAFSVASLVDSKTILDSSGAEKLLGQGDMLFSTAELAKPKRIQGAYLSDNEINDVVNYIKEKSGEAEYLEGITDRQKVGGVAGVGLDGNYGDEDELFEEAKEIIIKANKASTSMLQRRLSIGYGRAAKILDMLEEAGIVGPPNGSKPREVMISEEQYEAGKASLSSFPLHDRAKSVAPSSYLGEDENEEDEEEEDEVLDFSRDENSSEELEDDDSSSDEEEQEDVEEEQEDVEEEEEDNSEIASALELSEEEQEEIIDDENEILEEIREKKEDAAVKKKSTPLDDDDEMFFSK